MRHRKRGRTLGRSPSHRKAMLRNLASSLFLTEREAEFDDNAPKVKGRVTTTLQKAKEVRPLVERCITIAKKSLPSQAAARAFESDAERGTEEWKTWRKSEQWQQWNHAIAPAVTARRRAIQLLGDKEAVAILFDEIAPRMADRNGGYTRIMRLATPRLGDAGQRAILEFVGKSDRVRVKSEKPQFGDDDESEEDPSEESTTADSQDTDQESADDQAPSDQESGDAAETVAEDASADNSSADAEGAEEKSDG